MNNPSRVLVPALAFLGVCWVVGMVLMVLVSHYQHKPFIHSGNTQTSQSASPSSDLSSDTPKDTGQFNSLEWIIFGGASIAIFISGIGASIFKQRKENQ